MAPFDLAREGFVLESEWYWRLTFSAIADGSGVIRGATSTFNAVVAVSDFLQPLAWLARDRFALEEISADPDDEGVTFRIGAVACAIRFEPGTDRTRVDRFVGAVNCCLAVAAVGYTFALAIPRRYEIRGLLVPDGERAALVADPWLLSPVNRSTWR